MHNKPRVISLTRQHADLIETLQRCAAALTLAGCEGPTFDDLQNRISHHIGQVRKTHVLSLAEVRNGTGWGKGRQFAVLSE